MSSAASFPSSTVTSDVQVELTALNANPLRSPRQDEGFVAATLSDMSPRCPPTERDEGTGPELTALAAHTDSQEVEADEQQEQHQQRRDVGETSMFRREEDEIRPNQPLMYTDLGPKETWWNVLSPKDLALRALMEATALIGPTTWVREYNIDKFRADITSALVLIVMLVPQSLAYATLSGVPPIYGLYATIAPMFVFFFTAQIHYLGMGPVAVLSILTSKETAAVNTVEEKIGVAITIASISGVISLVLGIIQAGILTRFVSHTVTTAFTSAAAILIILGQFKGLFSIKLNNPAASTIIDYFTEIITGFQAANINSLYAFIIAVLLILYLFLVPKVPKMPRWMPHQLIVVIISTIVTYAARLDIKIQLPITGRLPYDAPPAVLPSWAKFGDLFQTSALCAVLGFVESYAVASKFTQSNGIKEISPNIELLRLGLCNVIGAFFSSIPVTAGSISRTAMLAELKPGSPLIYLITGILSVAVVVGLNRVDVFFYMPNVTLASIITAAAIKMLDYEDFIHCFKTDKKDAFVWFGTFVLVLFLGVDTGILIGAALGLLLIVFRIAAPHAPVLGVTTQNNNIVLRDAVRYSLEEQPDVAFFRFDAPLYFINCGQFLDRVRWLLNNDVHAGKLRVIVVDCSGITDCDSIGVHAFTEARMLCAQATPRCHVVLSRLKNAMYDSMVVSGVWPQYFSERNVFLTNESAVLGVRKFIDTHPLVGGEETVIVTPSTGLSRVPSIVPNDSFGQQPTPFAVIASSAPRLKKKFFGPLRLPSSSKTHKTTK